MVFEFTVDIVFFNVPESLSSLVIFIQVWIDLFQREWRMSVHFLVQCVRIIRFKVFLRLYLLIQVLARRCPLSQGNSSISIGFGVRLGFFLFSYGIQVIITLAPARNLWMSLY
jgi:hypothetical protein